MLFETSSVAAWWKTDGSEEWVLGKQLGDYHQESRWKVMEVGLELSEMEMQGNHLLYLWEVK